MGDRVFLGDDMWDVVYVKVTTISIGNDGATPLYRNGVIELLVKFAGKGRDVSPAP
jgi:hypothetical protein